MLERRMDLHKSQGLMSGDNRRVGERKRAGEKEGVDREKGQHVKNDEIQTREKREKVEDAAPRIVSL